ncbi:MAG: CDP-alcohol phosphatidyltransferase family protein [Flavobacteriales bacterium]
MKRHIPNILTLINLFCGCLAIKTLMEIYFDFNLSTNNTLYLTIGIYVALSLFFDFTDGLVARLLNVKSELGVQLDSLADIVTFGVLPGFMMVFFIKHLSGVENPYFQYMGLLITLFSALRLAKFNLDETQSENFKGLAVPANTIFIVSLAFISPDSSLGKIIFTPISLTLLIFLLCYLLVSNIPMFSFKMKNLNFSDNIHRYLLLIISIVLLIFFQLAALPFIIILYIVLSLIFKKNFA